MKYRLFGYSRNGYSLVELVLIISILGVLSVVAVPKIGSIILNVKEKAVSERLVEDINYLRSYAISHHDTTWLVVDAAENRYALFVGPSNISRSLIPDPHTLELDTLDLDTEYEGIGISSVSFGGSSEVSFNWWGTPSNGGTVVIGARTITLIPETGMAHETP